jgi:sigma-E factor negative regulatory protein RseC
VVAAGKEESWKVEERDGATEASWRRLAGGDGHGRREEGTVLAVRGELAEVLIPRGRQCEGCGSCCVVAGEGHMLAEALNEAGAGVGDRVEVELPFRTSLKAAYILYGLPLVAFLAGLGVAAFVSAVLFDGAFAVPLGLLFGFGFLVLSYLLLARVYAPGTRASSSYRPVITRVLR